MSKLFKVKGFVGTHKVVARYGGHQRSMAIVEQVWPDRNHGKQRVVTARRLRSIG